jgi:hypothetical protein
MIEAVKPGKKGMLVEREKRKRPGWGGEYQVAMGGYQS